MRALWLLAALLLSLLPSPAAASARAQAPDGGRYEAASPPEPGEQLRASASWDPVAVREQDRARWKSPRGAATDPWSPALPGAAPLRSLIHPDGLPAPRGSTPLCERLPYSATAPPLRG